MGRLATLSVLGIYSFDESIFDELVAPETIDRDNLIQNILITTAELECLYPQPETLKRLIGMWSATSVANFARIAEALEVEYDPIENYNRREDEEESATGNSKNTGGDTLEIKRAAFNSTSYQPAEQQTTQAGTGVNSSAIRGRQSHIHGNIGVTTTQQMLEQEIALRRKYNIYNIITEDFKSRFCVMVY